MKRLVHVCSRKPAIWSNLLASKAWKQTAGKVSRERLWRTRENLLKASYSTLSTFGSHR